MTAFNLIKSLTKRGNVLLGSGCYSAAIGSNDPNQIIKIGNSINDPWIDYYHLIINQNQSNPHVPKVKHFMCDEDHNYYICIMERLEEESYGVNKFDIADLCRDYTIRMITRKEFIDFAARYQRAIPCAETLANLLDKIRERTGVLTYEEDHDDATNRLDMHTGNFMFRDGVLVVTDPWCEGDMSDVVDVSDWVVRMSNKTTSASW